MSKTSLKGWHEESSGRRIEFSGSTGLSGSLMVCCVFALSSAWRRNDANAALAVAKRVRLLKNCFSLDRDTSYEGTISVSLSDLTGLCVS